jgi:hypothetical protein
MNDNVRLERRTRLLLAAVCLPLIIAGVAVRTERSTDAREQVVPLADLSDASVVEIRDHRGVTVLAGEFRRRTDSIGNVERDAALFDRRGRKVIGEVELETPAPGRDDRAPELEVDILGLNPTATYRIVIDDRLVGTFQTDDRGSVDMEVQEGEPLQIPGA